MKQDGKDQVTFHLVAEYTFFSHMLREVILFSRQRSATSVYRELWDKTVIITKLQQVEDGLSNGTNCLVKKI